MKIGFALRFVMAQKETIINMEKTVGLLAAAGVLMLLAGVLLGFLRQWVCAGLLCVGAFGLPDRGAELQKAEKRSIVRALK